jgi:hypothetical protein
VLPNNPKIQPKPVSISLKLKITRFRSRNMFEVSLNTTKRELLDYLQSVSEIDSELVLTLNSLPNFLNTQVAFTIFLYQISNYPRIIKWVTADNYIFEQLKHEGVELLQANNNQLLNQGVQNFTESKTQTTKPFRSLEFSTKTISPKLPITLQTSFDQSKENKTDQNSDSDSKKVIDQKNIINIVPSKQISMQKEEEVPTQSQNDQVSEFIPSKYQTPTAPELSRFSLNLKTMFNEAKYERSDLLDDFQTDQSHENSFDASDDKLPSSNSQNLDSWIDRITATKNALNSLKRKDFSEDQTPEFDINSLSYNATLPKKNNIFALALGAFLIIVLAAGAVFFPTQVYTLTVKPLGVEGSETLEIPVEDFETFNTNITADAQIDASGRQEVETDRAVGKVSLINPGNGNVSLDNGKFRLVYNDLVYTPIVNTTLPQSFSIPARNNANGQVIEFGIQATGSGSQYNLPENQKLLILNLKNDRVCGSCYALTTSEIKNSEIGGDRIFSESDRSLLRNTVDGKVDELRVNEVYKIQEQNIFTNQNWYTNISSDYKFSSEVNKPATTVNLVVTVNTNLFYLPQSKIEEKLKEKYPDLETITDIALVETDRIEEQTKVVKASFFFNYTKKSDISTENMKKDLSGQTCDNAKKDIVIKYDNINYVDCRQVGVQIPGLTPRVDVKIIETD